MSRFFFKRWCQENRRFCAVVLGGFLMVGLVSPRPLRGNYVAGLTTSHGCDAHAFVRFADGRVTFYHGDDKPAFWGTYQRTGWQTYAWKSGKDVQPIHVGWVLLSMKPGSLFEKTTLLHRDFRIIQNYRVLKAVGTAAPNEALQATAALPRS